MIDVPDAVRNKALAAGVEDWLEQLPVLVSSLEADWSIVVGRPYTGGSEAFVAEATRADGASAVLKVLVPAMGNHPSNEATVLRLVGGHGCPALYQYDADRGALLMERLGRPMFELDLPFSRGLEILCATAARIWRPAQDCGLPTGAEKARWCRFRMIMSNRMPLTCDVSLGEQRDLAGVQDDHEQSRRVVRYWTRFTG